MQRNKQLRRHRERVLLIVAKDQFAVVVAVERTDQPGPVVDLRQTTTEYTFMLGCII